MSVDKCPKCGKNKDHFMSQCDSCLDEFCRTHTEWPPVDAHDALVKYVSVEAFNKLWKDYIDIRRWGNDKLVSQGLDNLWNYEEKCWWAIHPENK